MSNNNVYSVIYALTDGKISDIPDTHWQAGKHGEGKTWFHTREEAAKKADDMRIKKIAALQNKIEKLKKMVFA
jgi:hypothetical protein